MLRSAVANAEANHGLAGDALVVAAAYADEGPTLKRGRPRARGRFARIHKRTCHITLKLAADPHADAPARPRAAAPAQADEPATEPKPRRRTPAKKEAAA